MLQRLTITFDRDERQALDAIATSEMRPIKDQIRWIIRQEAERRGLLPRTKEAEEPEHDD